MNSEIAGMDSRPTELGAQVCHCNRPMQFESNCQIEEHRENSRRLEVRDIKDQIVFDYALIVREFYVLFIPKTVQHAAVERSPTQPCVPGMQRQKVSIKARSKKLRKNPCMERRKVNLSVVGRLRTSIHDELLSACQIRWDTSDDLPPRCPRFLLQFFQ
jgi:hypothetical protein